MIMCGRHFENIATEAFSYWVIHSIDRYSVLFRCIDLMSYSLLKFNMMPPNSFVVFPHSKHAFIAWQTIFAETLLLCIYLLIRSILFGCRSQRYMMLLFAERTDNSSHNKSFGYIKTCAIPMNLLFWLAGSVYDKCSKKYIFLVWIWAWAHISPEMRKLLNFDEKCVSVVLCTGKRNCRPIARYFWAKETWMRGGKTRELQRIITVHLPMHRAWAGKTAIINRQTLNTTSLNGLLINGHKSWWAFPLL